MLRRALNIVWKLDKVHNKLSLKIKKLNQRGSNVLRVLVISGRKILGVLSRWVFSVLRNFIGQDQRSDGLLHSRLRTTPSFFGSRSDWVELLVSSKMVSPASVDGRGSSMVTLDKSNCG